MSQKTNQGKNFRGIRSKNLEGDPGKIYDISPEISIDLAVFPGDQKFTRTVVMDTNRGDPLTLSQITTTLHLGAHVDAPNHYHAAGSDIGSRALHYYWGECQVVEVQTGATGVVSSEEFFHAWSHQFPDQDLAKRILFKTGSYSNPNKWHDDFCGVCPQLVQELAEKQVLLIGIDTPSIDPALSKTLDAHQAVYANNMAILEGVVLTDVPFGNYFLSSLPLRIKGGDASPVRAILVEVD